MIEDRRRHMLRRVRRRHDVVQDDGSRIRQAAQLLLSITVVEY
jgi:hypothetical protein